MPGEKIPDFASGSTNLDLFYFLLSLTMKTYLVNKSQWKIRK